MRDFGLAAAIGRVDRALVRMPLQFSAFNRGWMKTKG
jgi:hypothetical protein